MRRLAVLAVLCLLLVPSARAGTQPARPSEESLVKMIAISGAGNVFDTLAEILVKETCKKISVAGPQMPPAAYEIVREEYARTLDVEREAVQRKMALLWGEHLTQEDVDFINEAFAAEPFRKMIAAQPQIMRRVQGMGQAFSRSLAARTMPRIRERLEEEIPELKVERM